MRGRSHFAGRVLGHAWSWATSVTDTAGRIALWAALLAIPWAALLVSWLTHHTPGWFVVAWPIVFVVLALAEGTYQSYEEAARRPPVAPAQNESQRRDSLAFRDHLATIKAFAREALDAGLFLEVKNSGRYAATHVITMSSPRARDFRAHFPAVAAQIDEWNLIADGYQVSGARFAGRTHVESEALAGAASALSQILSAVGQGDLDPGAISWREAAGRLEASWVLDIDKQPVFQPIASSNLTADLVARVKDAVERFPSTEAAVDWRARLDAANRQRPALEFALEQAGIAGELKGTCPDCPP